MYKNKIVVHVLPNTVTYCSFLCWSNTQCEVYCTPGWESYGDCTKRRQCRKCLRK